VVDSATGVDDQFGFGDTGHGRYAFNGLEMFDQVYRV
jgi:hypothetical protein